MGYKLAGYEHLGGVELDPSIAEIYKRNHHPKHFYTMDIRDFNQIADLPEELYNLDLLDGSPPCSTFSTSGSREKAWGKEKQFAEGQKMQRLDDLVFVYCDTIAKLKPKACLLENVSGLVKGNGKVYTKQIVSRLNDIGYNVQVFLLNAATMGVPQKRERVFVIGLRKDFKLPKLVLNFNEKPITFGEVRDYNDNERNLTDFMYHYWQKRTPTDKNMSHIIAREENGKLSSFDHAIIKDTDIPPTLKSVEKKTTLFDVPRYCNENELKQMGSFPIDYDAVDKAVFLIGMSVPPVMTAQISYQIYEQWLKRTS